MVSSKPILKDWTLNALPLFEAFCIALTIHVLLIPILWLAGWLLPWPKPPVVTTIMELDLSDWPREAKKKRIIHFIDPELNK
jgi:hypothetical protein